MNNRRTARWKRPLRGLAALLVLALAALGWAAWSAFGPGPGAEVQARVIGMEGGTEGEDADLEGYTRVEGPRPLVFPRDHGPHPDYLTEWWYYTGNLQAADGRRFGYQLTFFRRAIEPPAQRVERASAWAAQQVYMAHFAVTDVSAGQFYAFERFERGAAGLAGARGAPVFSVWLHDWQVEQTSADTFRLRAADGDVALALDLTNRKGITLQGDAGYSRKGPQPGNASTYYSMTRLESRGSLRIAGSEIAVEGWSWLDREISTSVLGAGQVGWDWFAIQLNDGSELMAYTLRRADGTIDGFSKGAFIAADGTVTPLARADFEILPEGAWRSPHSGAAYPARWRITLPGQGLELTVTPQVADQELNVSVIYWEGTVRVEGRRAGAPVSGYGYAELTGYAQSMEGEL
jgi:predicted secreted hydrolase